MKKNVILCLILLLYGSIIFSQNENVIDSSKSSIPFEYGALEFDYPVHFRFRFKEEINFKCWDLDGEAFLISYYEFKVPIKLDTWVYKVTKQFGIKNCDKSNIQIRLGNIEFIGKRIEIKFNGQNLIEEIYKVPNYDQYFIVFLDTKKDDGSSSEEGQEAMKIIDKTLKLITFDELEAKRKELEAKRKELEAKRKELEAQNIKLAEEKMKNLKVGMTLNQVDSILDFRSLMSDFEQSLVKDMFLTKNLICKIDYEMKDEPYLSFHLVFYLTSKKFTLSRWYREE
jgi:hypothetical protein